MDNRVCGIGMGATVGSLINLFVVGSWNGTKAVLATIGLSVVLLGVICDLLCLNLDRTFQYFGGSENAGLFLGNGILMAAAGGVLVGALLFTEKGRTLLTRVGL